MRVYKYSFYNIYTSEDWKEGGFLLAESFNDAKEQLKSIKPPKNYKCVLVTFGEKVCSPDLEDLYSKELSSCSPELQKFLLKRENLY